jgi:hypothetical protein
LIVDKNHDQHLIIFVVLIRGTIDLSSVIIKTNGSLRPKAVSPPSLNRWSRSVSKEEPETEDWLGKDIKDGVADDLRINRHVTGSISNTPDNWVQGPEDNGEESNAGEELGGGTILGVNGLAAWDDKLVKDDKHGSTSHGVVSPFLSIGLTESSKETEENHKDISNNGNEDVGTGHSSEESEIEEEERSGYTPVNVTSPEDLSVNILDSIWGVLVGLLDDNLGV